ncbi:MAG TPA: 4-alpha-glucanotransferase, partial [Waddliaceae bacterium]
NWQSWTEWPAEWRNLPTEAFYKIFEGFESEVSYHLFLQYLCFKQFKEMKVEATDHGIFLKGDIPILISKESADVWGEGALFQTEYSAGAPPDMYNSEGQNWGFPLYNWDEMEKRGYSWWKKRLEVASHHYDIYRIDHIVGFYRIWRTPQNSSARYGSFVPTEQWKWLVQGEKIMRQMLSFSHLLPIGEDLGTVPPEVRQNLRSLGICGTKVMRWERMWNEDKQFIKYADYDPLSMTTVSTHDSETQKQWWLNQPDEAKEFAKFKGWDYTPILSDDKHFQILRDSHHTASLFHINLLQEYLAQIPDMTSKLLEEERINVPGVVSNKNWSYRFLPSVEEIVASPELRSLIGNLLTSSSR